MDAERWQKVERVFHSALQAEPGPPGRDLTRTVRRR